MTFIEVIVLYCLQRIKGERTVYSVLHILNGKKSAQTIQDIHIFKLKAIFQTFPSLSRANFDSIILSLNKKGWIHAGESAQSFVIHPKKEESLKELLIEYPIPAHLNGWKYHRITVGFWERLSLSIQVASHLAKGNNRYMPVQRNMAVQAWMKQTLQDFSTERQKLNEHLFQELAKCLEDEDIYPEYLICRLTGADHIGLTPEQAAADFGIDLSYYDMCFLSLLHFMLQKILAQEGKFPILRKMILDDDSDFILTNSTKATYKLILQGYSLEEISNIRRLKMSTIEDHIAELVLNIPDFSIGEYVSKSKVEEITKIAKDIASKSLKQMKQQLPDATYFEIRIVLAKLGGGLK